LHYFVETQLSTVEIVVEVESVVEVALGTPTIVGVVQIIIIAVQWF